MGMWQNSQDNREFSQIGNVDPARPSTPWINILSDSKQIIQHYFAKKCEEIFKIEWKYSKYI